VETFEYKERSLRRISNGHNFEAHLIEHMEFLTGPNYFVSICFSETQPDIELESNLQLSDMSEDGHLCI